MDVIPPFSIHIIEQNGYMTEWGSWLSRNLIFLESFLWWDFFFICLLWRYATPILAFQTIRNSFAPLAAIWRLASWMRSIIWFKTVWNLLFILTNFSTSLLSVNYCYRKQTLPKPSLPLWMVRYTKQIWDMIWYFWFLLWNFQCSRWRIRYALTKVFWTVK